MGSAIFTLYKQGPRSSAVSPQLLGSLYWYRKLDGSNAEAKPDYRFTKCLIFEFYFKWEIMRITFLFVQQSFPSISYVAKCSFLSFASQIGLPSSRKCWILLASSSASFFRSASARFWSSSLHHPSLTLVIAEKLNYTMDWMQKFLINWLNFGFGWCLKCD